MLDCMPREPDHESECDVKQARQDERAENPDSFASGLRSFAFRCFLSGTGCAGVRHGLFDAFSAHACFFDPSSAFLVSSTCAHQGPSGHARQQLELALAGIARVMRKKEDPGLVS